MNVEQTLIQALVAKGHDAYASVPNPTPTTDFVTVERTGGETRDMVDHPMLAVQCWSSSRKGAADLADEVRKDLISLTGTGGFGAVTVQSIYNWPDPLSRKARYQITVDATAHV